MSKRFAKLANEPRPTARDEIIEISLKTTRVLRRERQDFMRDRLGHNGHGKPRRITYMAHAKGYVMTRHPGCIPFVISETDWLAFPYYNYWTDSESTSRLDTPDEHPR